MMINLAGRPRFFVGAAIGSTDWPHFRFIEMPVVGISLGRADGLAIGRAILTEANVTIGFFGLFLW